LFAEPPTMIFPAVCGAIGYLVSGAPGAALGVIAGALIVWLWPTATYGVLGRLLSAHAVSLEMRLATLDQQLQSINERLASIGSDVESITRRLPPDPEEERIGRLLAEHEAQKHATGGEPSSTLTTPPIDG
jgi:hypothetical protein